MLGVKSHHLSEEGMADERYPFVVMSWAAESCVFESGEPDDFIYETSGELLTADDDDGIFLIDKFSIYYVDVLASF